MKRVLGVVAVILGILAVLPAAQAEFPERPIKLIVPTGAGGGMDTTARIIQRTLDQRKLLPEKLAIVNMPGAAGTIGMRAVKDADPDGYTLGFWHEGLVTSRAMDVVDFDHNDFELIGGTGFVELGLGAKEDGPVADFETLIKLGKDKPDTLSAATNIGLTVHFFPLLVAEESGASYRFVQAGGGAKRLASILGGHTDFGAFGVNELVKHKPSGLKPIVILADERNPALLDVPTAKEKGIDISAQHTRIWVAPKGTPEEYLAAVRAALKMAMQDAVLLEEFTAQGISAKFVEPDVLKGQLDKFKKRVAPLAARVKAAR